MTIRNWKIVGLSAQNTVIVDITASKTPGALAPEKGRDSHEPPSAYAGITYLGRAERGILRKGITPAGNDRAVPQGDIFVPLGSVFAVAAA